MENRYTKYDPVRRPGNNRVPQAGGAGCPKREDRDDGHGKCAEKLSGGKKSKINAISWNYQQTGSAGGGDSGICQERQERC